MLYRPIEMAPNFAAMIILGSIGDQASTRPARPSYWGAQPAGSAGRTTASPGRGASCNTSLTSCGAAAAAAWGRR